ncbi:hypothetical protein [Nitrococcus mobilis]|nr:hypothetical protein [Nitrococcus mobilis]
MKHKVGSILAALVFAACASAYAAEDHSGQDMTMHHMHMMINHAVEMAAEGSNLIMLGQMGMTGEVDKLSISHGEMMIKNAQSLMEKVVKGKPMQSLHKEGATPKTSEEMADTHDLAKSAKSYIDMLSRMSQAPDTNTE